MKNLKFILSTNLKLEKLVMSNEVFELETNSSKLLFAHIVKDGFAYKLHRSYNGTKEVFSLDRGEDGLELVVTNAFLSGAGKYNIQIEAVSEDARYISNTVQLNVEKFINAEIEPAPEKINIIDKLLVKAEVLADKADTLETLAVTEIENGINVSYDEKSYDIVNGEKGEDGFAPTVDINVITGGHKITVTDKDGAKSFNVLNGTDGEDGHDYIITPADYAAIAGVVEQDFDVDGINNRLNTLDNETLDIYQKIENNKSYQDDYNEYLVGELEQRTLNDNFYAFVEETETLEQQLLDRMLDVEMNKQRTLIEGAGIEIMPSEDGDVISVTGGGGGGDVTKAYLEEHYYDKEQTTAQLLQKASVGDLQALNTLLTQKINTKLSKEEYETFRDTYIKNGLVNNSLALTDEEKLKIEEWLGLAETYLTTYNQTPYIVSGDYNPAHKKYVDGEVNKLPKDVQINGNSILDENKVAKIPKAGIGRSGVISIADGYGIGIGGTSGDLFYVKSAKEAEINARINDFTPIVPKKLDYAVKQAMCDGKGAEWTDTEKESARSRLGIVTLTQEEYDLIEVKNESTIYVIVG